VALSSDPEIAQEVSEENQMAEWPVCTVAGETEGKKAKLRKQGLEGQVGRKEKHNPHPRMDEMCARDLLGGG